VGSACAAGGSVFAGMGSMVSAASDIFGPSVWAGTTVTVTLPNTVLSADRVAVMVQLPGATAITAPSADTAAILLSLLLQTAFAASSDASVAWSRLDSPTVRVIWLSRIWISPFAGSVSSVPGVDDSGTGSLTGSVEASEAAVVPGASGGVSSPCRRITSTRDRISTSKIPIMARIRFRCRRL